MASTRFAPDRGLTFRMILTMVALGLLYLVLIGAVGIGIGGSGGAWIFAILIGVGVFWAQWYFSDRLALSAMGAREVSPQEEPELHAIIDRLCALADMPKPRVAVANMNVPNAFATGRSPDRAVVAVTTGLRNKLTDEELEAVLSHELSHVAHRDVLVMTIASVVGVLAGLMMRMMFYSSLGGNRNNNAAVVALVMMLVAVVVYAVSFLLTRVLSRYRELAADRAGAQLTGQPSALGSALTKISGEMANIPTKDLRAAEGYNAFFFAPAVTKKFDLAAMFSTHPKLERRLEQLNKISLQLGKE
ncbi:MAG TPA: zinc metalloprotease HtpX [Jiangellaceae bacterium]|nr:zinc metalloprotease HtpX [Jiangellaceae bacterium]